MTQSLRLARTLALALALGIGFAFLGYTPDASAQSPADAKRTLKIWKALYAEPGMMEIDVRYMRGTVLMTGDVENEEIQKRANEIIEKQRGVKEVRDRLRVRPPDVAAGSVSCEDIMAKIEAEIEQDEELAQSRRKYEVTCADGNVTLTGKLGDYTLAGSLLNEVRKTEGVGTIHFTKLKY